MKAVQVAWALGFVLLLIVLIAGGAVMYNYGYESGYQGKGGGEPSTFYGQSNVKVYEKKSSVDEQGNGNGRYAGLAPQDSAYSYGRDGQSNQYQSSQSPQLPQSQGQGQAESRSRYGSSYSASSGFSYRPSYSYRPRYYRYYPYYYSYYPPPPVYNAYSYPYYRHPYFSMYYPYYHRPYYI